MKSEELTAGFFLPEDAEGVAGLFTEIYGEAYPAKIVYDPGQLIKAFQNRDSIPIVVRTSDKRIAGYSSLFRAAPNRRVYEKGNGAVSADYRNAGVMSMIFQFVRKELPRMDGLDLLFGEPVCNHIYIQKAAAASLPFVETALEIDLMPAAAYEKERSALGRVSTLLMCMTVKARPHKVYIPDIYAEQLRYIYDGLDDKRLFSRTEGDLPSSELTQIETVTFESAGVARMVLQNIGSDFMQVFIAEEQRLLSQETEVLQVWLNLSWPWVDTVVTLLRGEGYFFGGVLPQWFSEDGLLMQKVLPPPNWEGIQLFSERARRIEGFIKTDWQQSTQWRT